MTKITEDEIVSIIKNFQDEISDYEIIDMEKYKGWSSEYLYLLVSAEDNFILKAKKENQTAGYDNEVKVSAALIASNIPTRRPILTKSNTLFNEQFGYYWCLMTYIPGAPSHVNEYNNDTVRSLAEHIDQYVLTSTSNPNFKNLDITKFLRPTEHEIIEQFFNEKSFFEKEKIINTAGINDLYKSLKEGYEKYLKNYKTESIIHNDINPRNILIDHTSRNVISLIDWDHVQFGNPLKDISDSVTIFYDNLTLEKASEFKKVFYESLKSSWFTNTDKSTIDFAFLYYFTVAKWRAVLFYLDLLRKYDNKYGERERFINEIKQNHAKWLNVVTSKYA